MKGGCSLAPCGVQAEGQPAVLGGRGWGRWWLWQPRLTFEGCKLFGQVLFITVLLVTEKLLQR